MEMDQHMSPVFPTTYKEWCMVHVFDPL